MRVEDHLSFREWCYFVFLYLLSGSNLKVSYKHLALEVVEVKKDIDDDKGLIEGIGDGVPLTVEDEISAGKLGIVVTCKRMIGSSLNLNVSISGEGVALKILEGVSVVGLYGTVDLIVEGEADGSGTRLVLTVYSESELGEVYGLGGPLISSGDVECLYFFAILAVSKNVYRSTTLYVGSRGLVTLLDLGSYDGLKRLRLNVCCVENRVVEGSFRLLCTGCGVAEVEVTNLVSFTCTCVSTTDVHRVDLVGMDNHVSGDVLEELTVDVVINRDLVVSSKLNLDSYVDPAGPAVLAGDSDGAKGCTVVTGKRYGSSISCVTKYLEDTYGGVRPTIVGRTVPVGLTTVCIDLELNAGVVSILGVNLEGDETKSVVSIGEASKLCGLGLTGDPELMLTVSSTGIDYFISTVGKSVGMRVICVGNHHICHIVHTAVKLVAVSTVRAGVSYAVICCYGSKVCVSSCMGICKTAIGAHRCTVSCEVVIYSVALPAARAGGELATVSALGDVVNVTVISVVAVLGVSEVEVIEYDTGVGNIGPTGDLESLNHLRIKSSVTAGIVKVSGVSAKEFAIDVVVNVDVLFLGHLDNDHNVEPLGPAILSYGNGGEVEVSTVKAALNYYAGCLILFDSEDVDGVVSPRVINGVTVTVVPVGSVSGLTNGEGEGGVPIGMTREVSLNVEGDNTYSVILAGETGEGGFATVVRGHPHLELTACVALTVILVPTVLGLVAFSGEVGSCISSGLEDVLILAIYNVKSNVTVRNVLHTGVGAVTVPIEYFVGNYEFSTAIAGVGKLTVYKRRSSVVLMSSVTEGEVVDSVTAACSLGVEVDVYALDSISVSSKVSGGGCYVLTVDVVVSDYLIGDRIENDLDSYVNPAGEAVSVNCELTKRYTVEASELGLAVSSGHYAEYGIVDSPSIAPTDGFAVERVNSMVNKLHLEVNVGLSVNSEGEVTDGVGSCGEAGELVGAAVCGRQPELELLLSAGLCISSDELEVTVLHYRIVSLIGVGGIYGIVGSCVSVHTVVVGTVGVVEGLNVEVVITSSTLISEVGTVKCYGESMSGCVGSTLSSATYGTGLCCCAGRSGVGVTGLGNSLECGVITSGASYVRLMAILGTGGSISLVRNLSVTESGIYNFLLFGNHLATYRTVNYAVVLTCRSTCGKSYILSYCCGLGVTKCGNYFLCGGELTTNGTLLTCGKTGSGTSSGSACYRSTAGIYVITVKASATVVTNEVGVFILMSGSLDRSLSYESRSLTAFSGTDLTVGKTCLGTGCGSTGNGLLKVAKSCISNSLSAEFLITYGTVGDYFVVTCVYTVRSYDVFILGCIGVAERRAFGESTCGTMLSFLTGSVCPCVSVLFEEPLGVLLVTEVHVVDCETGAGSSPTTHIEVVDIEVQDRLLSLGVKKVVSIGVYERVVDVVADGKNAFSVDLDEHLDVNPISAINGSEYVGGYVITGNFEGTVAVRHDTKDVKGVSAPTVGSAELFLVCIPVGIVSGGHDDNTHGLGDSTGLHTEGEYTEGFVGAVPTGHSVSMVLIVGGAVDHVLRSLLTCSDSVSAVYDRNGGITVLSEEEVRLIVTCVGDKLIGGEAIATRSTIVC